MATIIQLRRDTAANWTANNPILADGEPGFEKDTGKEKIGNGTTAWNALPYKEGGAAPVNIIDNLTSVLTDSALSANQGRVLKGFIDSINSLLNSDDTTLDELQEIVTYIKQNKSDLQNLSTSNIAGLTDALALKLDKGGYAGTAQDLMNAINGLGFKAQLEASNTKVTPADNDLFGYLNSVAANVLSKFTWANLKAALKTYFDTLYAPIGGGGGGGGNTPVPVSKPIDFQLVLADLNNHLLAEKDGEQIITIPHDDTLNLPIGFRCVIAWRGTGPVKIVEESRVRIWKSTEEILEIASKHNAIEIVKEGANEWGVFGALKQQTDINGDMLKILSINDVSVDSLSWLHIHKATDWPEFTIASPYFCIFSTDHDGLDGGTILGGVIWGECDDPYLTNFVEKGIIINGHEAETPWMIRVPAAESGIADELFLFFHNQDAANNNIPQETRLITTSGGAAPHLCTWTDRGNPITLVGGETHTGYAQVHRRGVSNYIMFHASGAEGSKISTSTTCLNFTRQGDLPAVAYEGGSFGRQVEVYPFVRNSIQYGILRFTTAIPSLQIVVATLDANLRPIAIADVIVERGARNFHVYYEGDTAYICLKTGEDNYDNKHPYYAFEYDLTNLD